jgi:excisionase family DNA binding protein
MIRPSSSTRRRLLSLPEAAEYLGLSPWTIRELAGKGRLQVVRITRKLLFDLKDLDALIDREKA